MVLPIAFLLGAAFGWFRAMRRGGDRMDGLQYAVGHGILFLLVALTLTILLRRLGVI